MLLTLYKEGYFDAAHSLTNYKGKCSKIHGHTWKVCIWVKGEEKKIQNNGILWDFNNIKKITDELDHQCLNDILIQNPTAENITLYIYKKVKKINQELMFKIRVYENAISKIAYCETGDF